MHFSLNFSNTSASFMTEEQKAKKREYAKNRYNTMIKAC